MLIILCIEYSTEKQSADLFMAIIKIGQNMNMQYLLSFFQLMQNEEQKVGIIIN